MTIAARLIREARLRAGLSQRQLAERLGTTQSAIARWEAGATEPGFDSVVRAVRAAGLELHFSLAEPDPDHDRLMRDHLRLDLAERVADLVGRAEVDAALRGAAVRG